MSAYQPPEGQGSIPIPTFEITDYSTENVEEYEGPSTRTRARVSHASSSSKSSGKSRGKQTAKSGSDTDNDSSEMSSSRSSKQSSKRHSSSKSKAKSDDWTEVTEPEERRRIQNRIAQRKFREKAREQRDQAQRDSQNRQHAGSSYHIPAPADLPQDADFSGLPWGSFNMPYIIARGHASASQQGSRRTSDNQRVEAISPEQTTSSEQTMSPQQYLNNPFSDGYGQVAGFDGRDTGSSGDERVYYEESPYFYEYETAEMDHLPDQGYGHGYQR